MSYTEVIKWLGPIGLMLDIFGAYLIFKFGLPEELSRSGSTNAAFSNPEKDKLMQLKAKKYDKNSKLGFCLLIIGFLLQLASSINSIYVK
jgi:hypothetical protein